MISIFSYLYALYEKLNWLERVTLVIAILTEFVALILFILELKEKIFPDKKPKPIIDIYKNAKKNGWNFDVDDGFQIIDFTDALKQSGRDGHVVFRGRANISNSDQLPRDKPFVNIPQEHWDAYSVHWERFLRWDIESQSHKFIDDNFLAASYSMLADVRKEEQESYNDLHAIGIDKKWYKNAALEYKGRKLRNDNEEEKYRNFVKGIIAGRNGRKGSEDHENKS